MSVEIPKPVEKFVERWKRKEGVEGIIVTGSFVTKYYEENRSDVDIYIVLSDKINWREKGNVVIDGMLIEYFANPIRQIKSYFAEEHKNNKRTTARMFLLGKILFDKSGEVKKLKAESKKWFETPFEKLPNWKVELYKCSIWDMVDELHSVFERDAINFDLVYFNTLADILKMYSEFLRVEVPGLSKIDRFILDEEFRKEYLYDDFPDQDFIKIFLKCLENKEKKKKLENVEGLCKHIFEKIGGFEIDGWKIRTKVINFK